MHWAIQVGNSGKTADITREEHCKNNSLTNGTSQENKVHTYFKVLALKIPKLLLDWQS
jgi:hypothetical protein